MSKPTLSLETNKQICEADGCFATAEEEIKISVGQIGEINLSVCSNCKPKFLVKTSADDAGDWRPTDCSWHERSEQEMIT